MVFKQLELKSRSYIDYWYQLSFNGDRTDTSKIRTIGLLLGPYRNLTTLTASIMALHPNCQVLNHAGDRIFANRKVNFFNRFDKQILDNFLKYALKISQGGKRGNRGGSITLSHAFANHKGIRDLYKRRYGEARIKENVYCLFWKESLRTSNYLRHHQIDLNTFFEHNSLARFLLPIRNPLDCAISNIKTGHANLFYDTDPTDVRQVVDAVLDEIRWVLELKERFPERFFVYTEKQFDADVLREMATFFSLPIDEQWIKDAMNSFKIKKTYIYENEWIDHYLKSLNQHLRNHPQMMEILKAFIE
ncbi:MAG: hypothetical protein GF313_16585 [Caldithrix sp.]|nr:hypothetical protein [Caldithrix sp.]